ncbi:NAD-dependent epimerase/dehydratase family protein [Levilactobacillus tongjiangensis]|uniref:NAD-dependent epimerase/dehydratase family protein n=1 Tax=Levilactobacillus tongjiangensis TaxID=2486023 RepID=A0ABW1SVE9_9LACO|nr:NAD-dependent epimerase/dehydratase family protein [Levilactobacillus tongjiangensis]
MQGIVQTSYQGIDALQLTTRPLPRLNPLAVRVTPVMPYDVSTENGDLKQLRPIKLPIVVGYGFGGIVREVGRLRNQHLLNQPVIGVQPAGSNQEQLVSSLPPLLFPVPQGVSLASATTLIGGADAAYFAFKKCHLRASQTVLITGASGSVGSYLLQLAQLFHVKAIAVGHSSRHEFLNSLGAEQVLDYDRPLSVQAISFATVRHVIDLAGATSLLDRLSAQLGAVRILSLTLPQYHPHHPHQTFSFASGAIQPGDYRWLLDQLAKDQLTAAIQEQLPYTAVKTAQHHLVDAHAAGRILLTYNQEVTKHADTIND